MTLRVIKLRFLIVLDFCLQVCNLSSQQIFCFVGAGRGTFQVVVYKNFGERVSDLLGQLRIGMNESDSDEIGLGHRVNHLACDDGVFIRLQLGQLLGGKRSAGYLTLAHHVKTRRHGWRFIYFLWLREDSSERRKHTALRLAPEECRIMLQVKCQYDLTRERRVLKKFELRAPEIGITLAG